MKFDINPDQGVYLSRGAGNGIDIACLMTASNMLIGRGEEGDGCTCQCPIIREFIVRTNDLIPDKPRNLIYGPLVYEILGTRTDSRDVESRRAIALTDWAVRKIAPFGIRKIIENVDVLSVKLSDGSIDRAMGLVEILDKLDPITDRKSAIRASDQIPSPHIMPEVHSDWGFFICLLYPVHISTKCAGLETKKWELEVAKEAADIAMQTARVSGKDGSFVYNQCGDIITHMASIGDKRPVETVITIGELADKLKPQEA